MEQYNFEAGMKYISTQGTVLSPREAACLAAALMKLKLSEKYSRIFFWGRVSGDEDDYYVAFGIKDNPNEFPSKKFYWTTGLGGFQFSELPLVSAEDIEFIVKTEKGTFRGKPGKFLGLSDEEQESLQQQAAEVAAAPKPEDGSAPPPPQHHVTELQRLSYIVLLSDRETSAVPFGAFTLNDNNSVIRDSTFKGLSFEEARHISNYGHFSPSKDVRQLQAKLADSSLFQKHFMDCLADDLPLGSWVVRPNPAANSVTLRSLLWPGYSAYHIPGTKYFGGAYFGNGIRNNDLAFLLM